MLILKEAILLEVDELEQSLAGVDLGFVIQAIHENFKEAHRGIVAENLRKVGFLVVDIL